MTIFVTQDVPKLDYTPAREFGSEMVAVFPPGGQITLSPQNAIKHARKILRKMTRDDWLLLVGDPIMIGICVTIAAELVGRVRLLRFNRRYFNYTPIEVDFLDSPVPEERRAV